MRNSDWSSDVCSSDLYARLDARTRARVPKFWNARTITEDVLGLTGSKLSWNDVSIVQRMFKDFFADTAPEIDAQVHSVSARAADPRVSEAKLQICAEKANALWQDMCNLAGRSEEHTSELQSLMRHSDAVFCL